jgi:hypothetical protein
MASLGDNIQTNRTESELSWNENNGTGTPCHMHQYNAGVQDLKSGAGSINCSPFLMPPKTFMVSIF